MSAPDHSPNNLAREDVHKSCKSLETVVNLLNGYCEAASTVVILQKKLVRAIRDTASMKASPNVANNTLNVAAAIFETISEVDGKFIKFADKECDSVNNDVKKWFRKLAREERIHDEKISSASARIKQAGQTYEKKAKKNPRDAAEEHTRYIQLLSSLGPEMSQEKINHSDFVVQKHAAVTCSVSSTLARIADAEWARCCEGVRKSSPQIGSLGEWRSLCDGGWMGKVPEDLPDIDTPVATGPSLAPLAIVEEELNSDTDLGVTRTTPANTNRDYAPLNLSPVLPSQATDPDLPQRDPVTVRSDVPALDYFPAPPVHFPLPHLQRVPTNSLDGPVGNPPSYGRRVTSPVFSVQETAGPTAMTPTELAATTATQTATPITNTWGDTPIYLPTPSRSDSNQTSSPADPSTTILTADDTEFGIRQPRPLPPSGSSGSYSLPKESPRSSGVVLAMRNRFAQNSISSTPPRESTTSIPRLPVSVSTITGRYQPGGEHPPLRSDRSRIVASSEPSSNDATGANTLGENTDFERTRRGLLLKERDLERRSKELELERQRLIGSAGAQAESSPTRNHGNIHDKPANAKETAGEWQNVGPRYMPLVGAESLRRGLTRSPSPVTPHTPPYVGSTGSPQENPRTAKPRGWIRRLSMPVLSSLDGSKKVDSPVHNDSSQAWSNLTLPQTNPRHRKTSLDSPGSKSNQRY